MLYARFPNNLKVSRANDKTFTNETTNQTVQGNYGILSINPSTGAFTYKASGTPKAIANVETFEYTIIDSEGRKGTNTIYIRFNEQGKPAYNWSQENLAAPYDFGTATSERLTTNLTPDGNGEVNYNGVSQQVILGNTTTNTIVTENDIVIPDHQSILAFDVTSTLPSNYKVELLDENNVPVKFNGNETLCMYLWKAFF